MLSAVDAVEKVFQFLEESCPGQKFIRTEIGDMEVRDGDFDLLISIPKKELLEAVGGIKATTSEAQLHFLQDIAFEYEEAVLDEIELRDGYGSDYPEYDGYTDDDGGFVDFDVSE